MRPAPLPPELGPVWSVSAARARGVHPERLRRQDLQTPFRGVRTTSSIDDVRRRCLAYRELAPPDAFFSHATAAELWGLPVARGGLAIHVARPTDRRGARMAGVISHHLQIDPRDLVDLDGLRVTSPARTWCDLATILDLEHLVAAGDRVLWRRDPLAGLAEVRAVARRHPGRRGRRNRHAALPLLSDRSDSPAESVIRMRILSAGLPAPVVNPVIRSRSGAFVARVDLCWPQYRMVLEYEGDQHRTDAAQWHRDLQRVPRLEEEGWHVTRAADPDLADTTRIIRNLERLMRTRTTT
ncbi:hypothetical protein [Pseudolysinimonas kribbensis]